MYKPLNFIKMWPLTPTKYDKYRYPSPDNTVQHFS